MFPSAITGMGAGQAISGTWAQHYKPIGEAGGARGSPRPMPSDHRARTRPALHQHFAEQRRVAPDGDMQHAPGLRRHRRPQAGKQIPRPLREQPGLIAKHQVEARLTAGRAIRAQ